MRRSLTALICCALATACAGSGASDKPPQLSAKARYVRALGHRYDGDSVAYYNELIALAHDEPDSRAGRRARATLASADPTVGLMLLGALAAVAIPSFEKSRKRAQTEGVKAALEEIMMRQHAYYAEHQSYCTTAEACAWTPPAATPYLFYFSRREVVGGSGDGVDLLRLRADALLDEMDVTPYVGPGGFVIVAVANLDDDEALDVWSADSQGEVVALHED